MTDELTPRNIWLSDYMIIGYFALLNLVLHLIAYAGYGYFRDEFYYIACSDHLAFGYVDHPPLGMLVLKVIRLLFGDSVLALRIFPILAGAAFVYFSGLLARELGGKRFAVILACTAAFAPMGNFVLYNIYSMNWLDHMFWFACFFIIIRIIKTGDPKYWLWFGVVAGLGLQNKISLLFLGFGVAVGVLFTQHRRFLKSWQLWAGGAVAALLFLPYILWNISHDWAALEFIHNAKATKILALNPIEFFIKQVLYNNPISIIVWLPGVWYFFFHPQGKRYRLLGWVYIAIYVLFTLQQAKSYYFAPAYPILFAGGALLWEDLLVKKKLAWVKPVLVSVILLPTLLLCPMCLPILPVEDTIAFHRYLGLTPEDAADENHQMGLLPQHFADQHGWPEMVEKVSKAFHSLTPTEQKNCLLYGTNYGTTGAMNFFGKKYGLPTAVSGHNNHCYWPLPLENPAVLIAVGGSEEGFKSIYENVEIFDRTDCRYAMPYENNRPIFICRNPRIPLKSVWDKFKHFD